MSDEINALMTGAFDLHMHGSPDVTARIGTDLELAQAANDASMQGILVKSHVTPTTSRARLVQDVVGGDFLVFGGLVLNKMAGGLNVAAVEAELKLGAKQIWLPTLSAVNQAKVVNSALCNSVPVFDEEGKLAEPLYDIFDLISKYDAILGTGHLAADEIERIVPIAMQRGVKKVLITHPESRLIKMPVAMQKRLAKQGAFFERCFFQLTAPAPATLPPEAMLEQIRATGAECSIISTDFGQTFNDPPVLGLQKYMQMLLDLNVSTQEIEIMVKDNPTLLLGL